MYNTDRFATDAAYLAKYPGDQYIDIMGFDIYQRGSGAAINGSFAKDLDRTITLLESIAKTHGKIPALTEFGNNGLADATWWTQTLQPVPDRHALAYVMACRTVGNKGGGQSEFYVPYPGQTSAADFKTFYNREKTLFQKDVAKQHLYR